MATITSLGLTCQAHIANTAVICPHCHSIFATYYCWFKHVQQIVDPDGFFEPLFEPFEDPRFEFVAMQSVTPLRSTLLPYALHLPSIHRSLPIPPLLPPTPHNAPYPVTARWIRLAYALSLASFAVRATAVRLLMNPNIAPLLKLTWAAEHILTYCPLPMLSQELVLLSPKWDTLPFPRRVTCGHGALDMQNTCSYCNETLRVFLGAENINCIRIVYPPPIFQHDQYICRKCSLGFFSYAKFLDHCNTARPPCTKPILGPRP